MCPNFLLVHLVSGRAALNIWNGSPTITVSEALKFEHHQAVSLPPFWKHRNRRRTISWWRWFPLTPHLPPAVDAGNSHLEKKNSPHNRWVNKINQSESTCTTGVSVKSTRVHMHNRCVSKINQSESTCTTGVSVKSTKDSESLWWPKRENTPSEHVK